MKTDIKQFIKYYSQEEMSERDDTDFDDDGGTIKSPSPFSSSTSSPLLLSQNGPRFLLDTTGVPETINEVYEDCTPTINKQGGRLLRGPVVTWTSANEENLVESALLRSESLSPETDKRLDNMAKPPPYTFKPRKKSPKHDTPQKTSKLQYSSPYYKAKESHLRKFSYATPDRQ
jgi:hypothetical protein